MKNLIIISVLCFMIAESMAQSRNISATREYVDKQIEFAEARITNLKRDLTNNIVAADSAISNHWNVTPKMPYTMNIEWDPSYNGGNWTAVIYEPWSGLTDIHAIKDVQNRQGDINAKELIFDLNIYDQTTTFTAVFIEEMIFAIRGESYVSQTFVENVSSNTIEDFKRHALTNSIIGIVTETSFAPTSGWIDGNEYYSGYLIIHTNGTPYVTYDYASGMWTLHGVSVENDSGLFPNAMLEFSNQLKAPENASSLSFKYFFDSNEDETSTVEEGEFTYNRYGHYVNKLGIVFTNYLEEASSNLYDTIVDNVINPDFQKFSNSVMSVVFDIGTNGVTGIFSNFLADASSNYNEFISGVSSNYNVQYSNSVYWYNEFIGGIDTNSIATIGEFLIKYNDGFDIKTPTTIGSIITLVLALIAYLIKKLESEKRYDTVSIFSPDYSISFNESGERIIQGISGDIIPVSKYANVIIAEIIVPSPEDTSSDGISSEATLKDRAMNYVTASYENLILKMPKIVNGKARDLQVTLDCKSGTVSIELAGEELYGDVNDLTATTGVVKMFIFTEIAENKWFINKIFDSTEVVEEGTTTEESNSTITE